MVDIIGKKILFVTAHPDDESFLAAGTMMKNKQAGGTNILVCATFGEKGMSHLAKPVTRAQLKQMRKQELNKVSAYLGVSKLYTCGLPDGGMQSRVDKLEPVVTKAITKHRPDYIISFNKDGITGHLDHIAVGKCAKALAKKRGIPFFGFSLAPRVSRYAHIWMIKRRKHGVYVAANKTTYAKPVVRVSFDPRVKRRALLFHASQLDIQNPFGSFPAYAVKEFLTREYFG